METILHYISTPWVYWTLLTAYVVTIFSIIGIVLSENRNPVKSLAWVTVLLLLPMLGIVLYVFFGRSIKNKHIISRRRKRRLRRQGLQALHVPLPQDLRPESRQQIRMARNLAGAPYFPGNEVQLFDNGADKFAAFKADIRAAREFIHIQYYIFSDDDIGREIAELLMDKAQQGVKVRVIYDHIGSIKTRNRFFRRMRKAGVEIHPFFRVVFPVLGSRVNWRNHRKVTVIDGAIGYIGGMNIADRYVDGPAQGKVWRDCHLRITGPAVSALMYSFAIDWSIMVDQLLEEAPAQEPVADAPGAGMQMLTSGPTSRWSEIAFLFLKAIGNAKQRVYIQTPYFLPTEALLKGLQAAALSKVDVRIMLPLHSDSHILSSASFSYITECLQAGIKIYLFEAGMIHSKTLLVDDEFCSVGSTNFDFRSFEHNFEGNLMIYSRDFNRQMVEQFRRDMKQSYRVNLLQWRKRPLWNRICESVLRLLAPVL